MLDRLTRAVASYRMRGDIESAIEYLPGLASLALWCRFADTTDEAVVAYTDGVTIFAGREYENFAPKERKFICLHEIFHIALCHPDRFNAVRKRDAEFNPQLLNIAADAIINSSLENLIGLETPANAWTLARIWQAFEKSDEPGKPDQPGAVISHYSFAAAQTKKIGHLTKQEFTQASRWSCEELYYFLKAQCQKIPGLLVILVEFDDQDPLGGDLNPATLNGAAKDNLTMNVNKDCPADGAEEKQSWQQRLKMMRGSLPEVFNRLAAEIPVVETPWEQILCFLIQTAFQESTVKNYSRPSRTFLALERYYRTLAGVEMPFSPDSTRKRGARLAVALDTSGSIDSSLLARFTAEIAALCAFNQRNLILIIGDAIVHQIAEIDWRDAQDELAAIKYTGGGGTDFRPLITAAAGYEPDALIYLTDLFGETGDAPDFPVIWATHGIAGTASWGEQIKLK